MLQQHRRRVDARRGAHALVHDRVPYATLIIPLLEHRAQHRVHLRRRLLVRRAQLRQNLQQPDLDERSRHAVVVVRLGQPVLHHLLEDGHEGGHEVLLRRRIRDGQVVQSAQRRGHDARVLVAEHLPKLAVQVRHRRRGLEVELVQRHHRLLSDVHLRVVEKLRDLRQHGRDGLLVDQPADGGERRAHHQVVVALQILLHGVDDEDDELVVLVEEGGSREVSHALQRYVRFVRRLHRVDVAERGVVAEHLDVHEANEILLELVLLEFRPGEDRAQHHDLPTHDGVLIRLVLRFACEIRGEGTVRPAGTGRARQLSFQTKARQP